ncbi:MAG: lactate utilization protein [Rhodothermales bacterium]|nr:lactate utilization protein [Rhodothermales bacterium]
MKNVSDHAQAASTFVSDAARTDWHDESLWQVRSKRDTAARAVDDWEELRQMASDIKDNVLANLDTYLIQLEKAALANGIEVHWAADAEEHNSIVADILAKNNARKVVKSKSMLTEECGLNPFLEEKGYEIFDTDLGERIVQLLDEPPSHIVMPAIHKKKSEIGSLFHEKMGTPAGESDPQILTEAARQDLRKAFLSADAAITGVNFGIAETGGFVVCTNEGNADLGMHLAPLHIACMGIEKIIPRAADLSVFMRLLARSATGQPVTIYSSHIHAPRPGARIHLILVDNGRSEHLAREKFRSGLKCIRCGACMNTCPVYRRSGGHSYHATLPGPIGAILNPGFDLKGYGDLPFASTLCGSCNDVCPVKIDIHEQLFHWRQVVKEGQAPLGVKAVAATMKRPRLFKLLGSIGKRLARIAPGPARKWLESRDLPPVPRKSLGELLAERESAQSNDRDDRKG